MSYETSIEKGNRYAENLRTGEDPKRALRRLFDLNLEASVYHDLNVRKLAKKYVDNPDCGKYAVILRDKLKSMEKETARKRHRSNDGDRPPKQVKQEAEGDTDQLFSMAMSGNAGKAEKPKAIDYSKYKITRRDEVKQELKEEAYDPSFDAPSSSKGLSHPQTSPQKTVREYAPSSTTHMPVQQKTNRPVAGPSEASRADENMFKPRKDRQKVFAGRRRKVVDQVYPLISLCQSVLASNIDVIGYVGWAPYELLKPALTRATVEQLRKILDLNPILAKDADELFHQRICQEFPAYKDRNLGDDDDWRHLYDRLVTKRDKKDNARLETLTRKIGSAQTANDTGRKTMVIEAAHTNKRVHSFFPTVRPTNVMTVTPSAIELSQARKNTFADGRSQLSSVQAPAVRQAIRSSKSGLAGGSSGSSNVQQKKTAPLMAKVKKMLKK